MPLPGPSSITTALSASGMVPQGDNGFVFLDFCRRNPRNAVPAYSGCNRSLVALFCWKLRTASVNSLKRLPTLETGQ